MALPSKQVTPSEQAGALVIPQIECAAWRHSMKQAGTYLAPRLGLGREGGGRRGGRTSAAAPSVRKIRPRLCGQRQPANKDAARQCGCDWGRSRPNSGSGVSGGPCYLDELPRGPGRGGVRVLARSGGDRARHRHFIAQCRIRLMIFMVWDFHMPP